MNDKNTDKLENKLNVLEQKSTKLEHDVSFLKSKSTVSPINAHGDEIQINKLINIIWQSKIFIICLTSIFAITAAMLALYTPNEYRSTVLLAPATQSSGAGGLAKLAGQFGGLASLAGIDIGGNAAEDKSIFAMEIIKTWGFLEKFIDENEIHVQVIATKGWNSATNELVIDQNIYDVTNNRWVAESDENKNEDGKPSSWEMYEELKDRIAINQDKNSGLISLSVEHFSPHIAKEWTDKLVDAINRHIQDKDREEATRSIEYLNEKIDETNNAEMQIIFYQLIEEQTKTLMLAEVSSEYALKTLSPAKVPEVKVKPNRALIVILGIFLGAMLSVLIVLIRNIREFHSA